MSTNSDSAGYPVGNRTERPHHPDGWFPDRPEADRGAACRRGQPPASGTHDRPKKN